MEKTLHTKDDIIKIIAENYVRIKALGVKRLGIFGSFVRGEQNSGSDIDVLVEFHKNKKTLIIFSLFPLSLKICWGMMSSWLHLNL